MPEKEDPVPLKICSMDRGSSSHGDFPMAIKTYKKLAGDMITHWNKNSDAIKKLSRGTKSTNKTIDTDSFWIFHTEDINCVYPKEEVTNEEIDELVDDILCEGLKNLIGNNRFKSIKSTDELDEDDELYRPKQHWGPYVKGRNSEAILTN